MSPLHCIVYISRNELIGTPTEIDGHVAQILRTSRRNNAAVGVTGALMFHRGCFAQVLEGTHEAIEAVFERIQCDDRHSCVDLLSFEPIEHRRFARWTMAHAGGLDDGSSPVDGVAAHDERDIFELTGSEIGDLLTRHLFPATSALRDLGAGTGVAARVTGR